MQQQYKNRPDRLYFPPKTYSVYLNVSFKQLESFAKNKKSLKITVDKAISQNKLILERLFTTKNLARKNHTNQNIKNHMSNVLPNYRSISRYYKYVVFEKMCLIYLKIYITPKFLLICIIGIKCLTG